MIVKASIIIILIIIQTDLTLQTCETLVEANPKLAEPRRTPFGANSKLMEYLWS